jgi:hypothetical protein
VVRPVVVFAWKRKMNGGRWGEGRREKVEKREKREEFFQNGRKKLVFEWKKKTIKTVNMILMTIVQSYLHVCVHNSHNFFNEK